MKKISVVLILLLFQSFLFSQTLKNHTYSKSHILTIDETNDNLGENLFGKNIFPKTQSTLSTSKYLPQTLYLNDNSQRKTFTYDEFGRLKTETDANLSNSNYVNSSRMTYTYNNQGTLIESIAEAFINDVFVNQSRYLATVDNLGNIILEETQSWENQNWVTYRTNSHTYDERGNALTDTIRVSTNNVFEIVGTNTCTYNSNNDYLKITHNEYEANSITYMDEYTYVYDDRFNLLSQTYFQDHTTGFTSERITYTYDNQNNVITTLYDHMENASWVNEEYILMTYDNSGNMATQERQLWENGAWIKSSFSTYQYDSNNKIVTLLGYVWNENSWVNTWRRTYTYNQNSSLLQNMFESVDENNNWVARTKTNYTYDSNFNAATAKVESYNGNAWHEVNGYIQMFYNNNQDYIHFAARNCSLEYLLFTDVEDEITNNLSFSLNQNYPNPFNPTTTISFNLPNAEFVNLKVYDVLGREIATLVNEELTAGQHIKIFNAENLSSGVYFYKLQAGKFSETKKMLLTK